MSWLPERHSPERKDLKEEGNQHVLSSPAFNKLFIKYPLYAGIWDTLVNKKAKIPALMELICLQNVKVENT